MHSDSLTGRSQRRTAGQHLPEPRLLIDKFLLGRHAQHLRSERCCDDRLNSPLAVEIGDFHRLSGRSIGAYLGLVPTESSSGASRSLGGITKTGNGHARRLLIEAAWHHRRPYRPRVDLRRRWDNATPAARARGQQGNRRLHARWTVYDDRRKRAVVANTAIARELAGWCWSLAVLDNDG